MDYAGGHSLAAATPLGTTLRVFRRDQPGLTVASEQFDGVYDSTAGATHTDWRRYVAAFDRYNGMRLSGWHWHLSSTLPPSAGMSSSASLLLALLTAADACTGIARDPMVLARLAQKIETEGVGVGCGLLDQLSILFGNDQHLVHIHYAPVAVDPVPCPAAVGDFLVIHTGIERSLQTSGYNDRPRECADALAALKKNHPHLEHLAQAKEPWLEVLETPLRQRARHVVREVARVNAAAAALQQRDGAALGSLLNAAHESLSGDFAVSLPPIDTMVARLQAHPAVLGARLMGGGFGGGVLALARPGQGAAALEELVTLCAGVDDITPRGWLVPPSRGVGLRS